MSAFVPVRDLWNVLLPRGCQNGRLAMLSAYFDDSGTHAASRIVAVAGVMGTESELTSLEDLWREQLERPLDGLRPPITEFHAHDCFKSKGEFAGWNRAETDLFRRQLRDAIIKSHVSAYGIAYFKADWDAIITGDLLALLGNAEGNAVRNCFVRALRWAYINAFDPDIAFVFDDSDNLERKRDIHACYDAFRRHAKEKHLSGIAFLNSKKVLPLQAADLFAWEFNRNAHQILEKGLHTPSTPEYLHLGKGMNWMDAQIARKDKITEIRDHAINSLPPDVIKQMSDYFKNFAPVLSGRKKLRKRLSRKPSRKP